MAKWLLSLGLIVLAGWAGGCDRRGTESPTATVPAPPPEAAPPPPPVGAFLAQLSPDQLQQLEALGVEVVVPGVVPAAFSVADIQANPGSGSGPDGGASYSIVYRDGENHCFAIEFAAGGIGDMPAVEHQVPISPPLFSEQDYSLYYGQYVDPQLRAQFPESDLHTDWMAGGQGFYRLIGAAYINSTLLPQAGCQDIAPETAVGIVESLTVTTSDVIGDG